MTNYSAPQSIRCRHCLRLIELEDGAWRHIGNRRTYCTVTVPVQPEWSISGGNLVRQR